MSESPDAEGRSGADAEPNNGPRSVHRALEILTFVVERGPLSLLELATLSGLPSSTALRSLRALEHWGYVFRAADATYVAGSRFVSSQIPVAAAPVPDLVDLSVPFLERASALTGESSYLAIPGPAGTCIYLREVQTSQPVRFVGFEGWTGRAVARADSAVGEVLDGRIPGAGYCTMEAALTPEAHVVAVPVHDAAGGIVAAISVAGPSFRLTAAARREFGPRLRALADELSARLRAAGAPSGAAASRR